MHRLLTVGMCLFSCYAASGVLAQSLINPTFDTDVSGWSAGWKSTVIWDALDADADPASGSALVTNQSDTAGDSTGAAQCVDGLIGGATYRFRTDILVPTGQAETGHAHVLVQWYDDHCYGHQVGGGISSLGVGTSTPGVWYTDRGTFVAPADTKAARIRLSVWKDIGTGTLDSHFDNVSFSLAAQHLSFVPAAGFAHGDAGSFWVTDLDVNNPNDETMTYELWWLPRGEDNFEPATSEPFTLEAGRSRRHQNVLGEVFGLDPSDAPFGALAIASDGAGALAMARVFNQPGAGGGGTFGQSMPSIPTEVMIPQNEKRRILFLSEDDNLRANVGCQNGTGNYVQIRIEPFDASGHSYEELTMDLPPFSNNQINRIFRDWAPMSGYVDVWSNYFGAAFTCYGSVLDNISSDPTTVLPQ